MRLCPRGLWCGPAKKETLATGSGGSNPPRRVQTYMDDNIYEYQISSLMGSLSTS